MGGPRVPAAYPALDSDVFKAAGGPALDALILDTMGQAHNRLQAAGSPMFSVAVPLDPVTWGDTTSETYSQPARSTWSVLVPPFLHPKKPGHDKADYEVHVEVPSGFDVQFQIVTQGARYVAFGDDSMPQIETATGTGSWQTVSFSDVPVVRGTVESCALFVRSREFGTTAATTYGSPVTGIVERGSTGPPQADVLDLNQSPLTTMSWNTTAANAPDDFGTRGYTLQVSEPGGTIAAHLRIEAVAFITPYAVVTVHGLQQGLRYAISTQGGNYHTFKVLEPVRVRFAGMAGATTDRSP